VANLARQLNLAYWDAQAGGRPKAGSSLVRLETAIRGMYARQADRMALEKLADGGRIRDEMLSRQLHLLLLAFRENQLPEKTIQRLVQQSNDLADAFHAWRPVLDSRKTTPQHLLDLLMSESDSTERRQIWAAFMARGQQLAPRLIALVKLRNQAARQQGFDNYYRMQLEVSEMDADMLHSLLDGLAAKTDRATSRMMTAVNARLARRFGIGVDEIRPWHFEDPFFQRSPGAESVDLQPWFARHKPQDLVRRFFSSMGFAADDILRRSSLKGPAKAADIAFCLDVDREGDVRIHAPLENSEGWTSLLMHEMAHGLYNKHIDPNLPWLLRQPAGPVISEGVAQLFGRLTRHPDWLADMRIVPPEQLKGISAILRRQQQEDLLVFVRWSLLVVHFERELYRDPGQDLNSVWRELKKRYQMVAPADGRDVSDWACLPHLVLAPATYQNYLLGEMMAGQLLHHLAFNQLKGADPGRVSFVGRKDLGRFFKDEVFSKGARYHWAALVRQTTGQALEPDGLLRLFGVGEE
jgi:peptidyl-dipeptidase A